MSKKNTEIATEAAVMYGVFTLLSIGERLFWYAMEDDVLVEEKAYLKENAKILRLNFTK